MAAERVLVGEGPSVRRAQEDDGRLSDFWRPLLCLRQRDGASRFVSVIETHGGKGAIERVDLIACEGTSVVLRVTERDRVRIVGVDPTGVGVSARLPDGRAFKLEGRVGVSTETEGRAALDLVDGARLQVGDVVAERTPDYEGELRAVAGDVSGQPERNELVTDVRLPEGRSLAGKVIYVTHPSSAESAYLIDSVEAVGAGSRVRLAGSPRFVWGRGTVESGGRSRFESSVEQSVASAYAGRRVRVGDRVFTIRDMIGRTTFVTEETFDFQQVKGEAFTVFSTAAGDRFRIGT
jgi:hypothetical protein